MWFFIVTLMVIGAFFLGGVSFSCFVKDIQTDREYFSSEIKFMRDALREFKANTSRPYGMGAAMPGPSENHSPFVITSEDK
jgi:hypothetical protein